MKKRLTYNFINPNTDDETADYLTKILSQSIAKNLVYAEDDISELIKTRTDKSKRIEPQPKMAVNS
jgi:hypothetical protein